MNDQLLATLQALPADPTRVVSLYEQLFGGQLIALVKDATQPLAALSFLTYPSGGSIRELPLFISPDRRLLAELQQAAPAAVPVTVADPELWPRLYEAIQSGDTQVVVDPGEAHGIRLSAHMILGIVQMYGTPASTPTT